MTKISECLPWPQTDGAFIRRLFQHLGRKLPGRAFFAHRRGRPARPSPFCGPSPSPSPNLGPFRSCSPSTSPSTPTSPQKPSASPNHKGPRTHSCFCNLSKAKAAKGAFLIIAHFLHRRQSPPVRRSPATCPWHGLLTRMNVLWQQKNRSPQRCAHITNMRRAAVI